MPLRQYNKGQFQVSCEISGISGQLGALKIADNRAFRYHSIFRQFVHRLFVGESLPLHNN